MIKRAERVYSGLGQLRQDVEALSLAVELRIQYALVAAFVAA
ncbi:MAG: hypothetical protein ABTD50_09575 [Polyangiaceae bacterium]|jgi:hypothetical protein